MFESSYLSHQRQNFMIKVMTEYLDTRVSKEWKRQWYVLSGNYLKRVYNLLRYEYHSVNVGKYYKTLQN